MTKWVRFEHDDRIRIGRLEGDNIEIYRGNLFSSPVSVDDEIPLEAVQLLTPVSPKNFLGLWNNFRERASLEKLSEPEHPLYFTKTSNCLLECGGSVKRPPGYSGSVAFEAELGIVIGQRCHQVSELSAPDYIFGYTCVNDLTAVDLLNTDPNFVQWTRAKSAPTFGAIGPVICTEFDPTDAAIQARVNGEVRQDFPVSDMFFSPNRIVSAISHDMELYPGDVIACGTSIGSGELASGDVVDIVIDGIGVLSNTFAESESH